MQLYRFGVIIDPCSTSASQSVSFSAVFSALFAFPVSVQRAICQTDRKVAEEVKLHVDTTRIQQQALRLTIGKRLKKCTAMKKQHRGQKGKKRLVCLNVSECKGSSQPLNLGSFCHSLVLQPCSLVSSPQSRSLFPYSLCSCSPICCGRQSSTARSLCVPAFKWLFSTLHLLLFLSACLNI